MNHDGENLPADGTKESTGHTHAGGHSMSDMPGMNRGQPSERKPTVTSTEGLTQLSKKDRASAEKQFTCPVSGELIGSMGKPIKVTVNGREVWLCCDSCQKKLLANPDEYPKRLHAEHGSGAGRH